MISRREFIVGSARFVLMAGSLFLLNGCDSGKDIAKAYESGHASGVEQGKKEGIEIGIQQGRAIGREEGRKEGMEAGFKDGFAEGEKAGLVEGRKAGVAEGRRDFMLESGPTAMGWGFLVAVAGFTAFGLFLIVRKPVVDFLRDVAALIKANWEEACVRRRIARTVGSLAEREAIDGKIRAAEELKKLRESQQIKGKVEEEIVAAWQARLILDFQQFWNAEAMREATKLRELVTEISSNSQLTQDDQAKLFKKIQPASA